MNSISPKMNPSRSNKLRLMMLMISLTLLRSPMLDSREVNLSQLTLLQSKQISSSHKMLMQPIPSTCNNNSLKYLNNNNNSQWTNSCNNNTWLRPLCNNFKDSHLCKLNIIQTLCLNSMPRSLRVVTVSSLISTRTSIYSKWPSKMLHQLLIWVMALTICNNIRLKLLSKTQRTTNSTHNY